MGIGRLILETNALMVKQALSFDNFDAMPEGGQVNKLKFLVSSSFIHFECVLREGIVMELLMQWRSWVMIVMELLLQWRSWVMSAPWERVDYKLYIPCNVHVYVDMMLIFQQMSNAST